MFWKNWNKRTISVPASNETKRVESVELTYVKWRRRYGDYSGDTALCIEAFTNEVVANEFAESLRSAFKLLKHTSGTKVIVEKQLDL